jgi:hypothetical protein
VKKLTYDSELMVVRRASEQIAGVVSSITMRHTTHNKRHNALYYDFVRDFIAPKATITIYVEGKNDQIDLLTKYLGWFNFLLIVVSTIFWKEDSDNSFPMITKAI